MRTHPIYPICVFPLLLAWSMSGCGAPDATDDHARRLLANPGTVFGSDEGPGVLSSVWDVDVSTDGHVFASEPQFAHVIVFGPDGSYVRTIGRRGLGPGEFQVPGNLSWTGDTLVVFDFQSGGNLFSVEGEYYGRVSFKLQTADNPSFAVQPIFLLADGNVMGFAPVPTSAVVRGERTQQAWLTLSRGGELLDTLALQSLAGQYVSIDLGQREVSPTHPLASNPLVAVPPDGSFMVMVDREAPTGGEAPSFRVHRIALDGDTALSQELPYSPIELTDSEIDSIARSMATGYAARYALTVDRAAFALRQQIPWPHHRPPVTNVLAASDGSVWLRRETAIGDSIRWDVLDARLRHVGFVYLPSDLDVKVISEAGFESALPGWHVYGVVLDAFDVPSLMQYQVSSEVR